MADRGEGITQKEKMWLDDNLLGLHESKYWSMTYHVAGEDPIVRHRGMPTHYYCFDQANCLEKHKAQVLVDFRDYLLTKGVVMVSEQVECEELYSW